MERFVTLGQTSNFRHMGGYATGDGRVTRPDRLYRSGFISAEPDEVAATFGRLGIGTVFDFRSPVERTGNPLPAPPDVTVVELGMLVASVENLWSTLLVEGLTPAGAEATMDERYRELTREEVPGYRTMFEHLVNGDGDRDGDRAALVMCSFGKDRAGIAAALLLSALGVLPEHVEADYLLSAAAYADTDRAVGIFERFFNSRGLPVDRSVVEPILDAKQRYLRVALDLIDDRAGSMDGFLSREMGLDAAARRRLAERFTAPAT